MIYSDNMCDKVIELEEKYKDLCNNNPDNKISEEKFYLLHILNEQNRWINDDFINNIFTEYGLDHKVETIEIYREALIHDSYLVENLMNQKYVRQIKDVEMIDNMADAIPLQNKSYQRLEYYGDAVIHVAIAQYLYNRYPKEDEGFLTKIRTRLENGESGTMFCRCLGLNNYIIISRYMESMNARINNNKVLEDVFESFIGALATEISIDKCINFIINILEKEADITNMICYETNFKGKLMKICHKMKWEDIQYIDYCDDETEKKKIFKVKAVCGEQVDQYTGHGYGKSKRKAQQKAAKDILIQMGEIINDNIDDENDIYEISDSEVLNNTSYISEDNEDDIYEYS